MALRAIKLLLRYLTLLLIAVYFLVAGFLLVSKYWFLPQINSWRPQIEASISEVLGVKVQLDRLDAQWQGLTPSFELKGLTIFDTEGDEALVVPSVKAILSWRSIPALELRFRYIGLDGLALAIQRDTDDVVHIAGFKIDLREPADATPDVEWHRGQPVRWLLAQGRVDLNDAIVIWIDQARNAPPLIVSNFSFSLRNGLLSHQLSGRFDLSSAEGQRVAFSLKSDRLGSLSQTFGDDKVDGELYLALSEFQPRTLAPWVDLPEVNGRYAARAWLDLQQGQISKLTLDLAGVAAGSGIKGPETTSWLAKSLNVHLSGPVAMLTPTGQQSPFVSSVGATQPVVVRLQADGMLLEPPADVYAATRLDKVELQAQMQQAASGELSLSIGRLQARTPDGSLSLAGTWRRPRESEMGIADIKGTLANFDLSRLYHYMPSEVGADTIEWLKQSFVSGVVPQAAFVVTGPLEAFPFETAAQGVFTMDGSFRDWGIDYAPPENPGVPGWPALAGLDGKFSLNRDVLSAQAHAGGFVVTDQIRVAASRINATISHLYSSPKLEVQARTQSAAQNYHKALTATALAQVVPAMVNQLKGQGQWNLDIDLAMPLEDVEQVDFKATLDLNGGSLAYAELPAFQKVTGKAVFSNTGFESLGLKGQVLGGDVSVSGGFGIPDQPLGISGSLGVQALNAHFNMPSLNQWLKGQLLFDALVMQAETDGLIKIELKSSLEGLQMALPAPLNLGTNARLNTTLEWEVDPNSTSVGRGSLRMGNLVQAKAVGRSSKNGSTLASVAIGIGSAPPSVNNGMSARINTKSLDALAWQLFYDSLQKDLQASSSSSVFMPPLSSVQLTTDQLIWEDTSLDKVNVNLQVAAERYSAEVSSQQANGSVSWQMKDGEFVGRLRARLARLEIGAKSPDQARPVRANGTNPAPKLPDEKTLSTIPPIELVIDDLVLHGMKLGRLDLVGENAQGNRRWNIQKLGLTSPSAKLNGSGQWRFDQDNPGVDVDMTLDVTDLGEMLARLGQPDQVRRGAGTIKAQVDWRNFPWYIDVEAMAGKVQVDLNEGIFDHVNSRSARVLELLSLQSFSRLLNFNVNRNETFEKGFPWSSIEGNLDIERGVLATKDLAINSPVATISFDGGTSIKTETWDMRATVRPNLDLSGTAMVTGFLMNPVIGLSALVGQYILKNPIESMLSIRYTVTGPWAEPQLTEIGATPVPATSSSQEQGSAGAQSSSATPSTAGGSGKPAPDNGKSAEVPQREVYRIELGQPLQVREGQSNEAAATQQTAPESRPQQQNPTFEIKN